MLAFFRRYERIFFVVITALVIFSFSFFGTFQAASTKQAPDPVVFRAVDGSPIHATELRDMIAFLNADAHTFLFWNMPWGGNSLNNGVIAHDIIDTGLVSVLLPPYLNTMKEELQLRLEREKRYVPYTNPHASFICAERVWAYFAPKLKKNFDSLRRCNDAISLDALNSRIELFRAERQFPGLYLKHFIKSQEAQTHWLPPDQELLHRDLSLFGYHTAQDWFGKSFVDLVAQYIINAAKIAQEKGLTVTKEEALNSLYINAEKCYQQVSNNPYLNVDSFGEFFHEQLRRLGMTEPQVIHVWQQVLLFRKLMQTAANSVIISTLPYEVFYKKINEYCQIDLFALQNELRFAHLMDVEKFEVWLSAIRGTPLPLEKGAKYLELPTEFLSPDAVKKIYPELVQKTFVLKYATFDKDLLQTRVSVQRMWQWQVEKQNWQKLQKQFPDIAQYVADTDQERLAILDNRDDQERARIDAFSRKLIVDEHPEWLTEALDEAPLKEGTISIREQGGPMPFPGITDHIVFLTLLNKAPLNTWVNELSAYSQDGRHYVRVQVVQRDDKETILPYSQGLADGTMQLLFDKVLEAAYRGLKQKTPRRFLKENGEWKSFAEAKDDIAAAYFSSLIESLDIVRKEAEKEMPHFCNWANVEESQVACRFLPYLKKAHTAIIGGEDRKKWVVEKGNEHLHQPIDWRLVSSIEQIVHTGTSAIPPKAALAEPVDAWTSLRYYAKTGPVFFKVLERGILPYDKQVRSKVLEAKNLLGNEAICDLGGMLLEQMQGAHAIDLQNVYTS